QGGASLFVSDVFVSNLSTADAVDISLIYGPANGTAGGFRSFPNKIRLNANERKEYVDFFPSVLPEITNPFGILVFNACKAGADCTPDSAGESINFRPISVESRIYAITPGSDPRTAASSGQDMPGVPFYNYISREAANGVNKVFITGFRANASSTVPGYRSNLGVVNASQFSTTEVIARLRDGATGTQVGNTKIFTLAPLSFEQPSLSSAFGSAATGTNLY